MGAGQSKPETDEHVFLNETPVQFSQDVVNQLADAAAAPGPSLERQSSIDAQIQTRIHAELARLQQEEQEVRKEIERTLEKENLNREGNVADEGGASTEEDILNDDPHGVLNSTVLLGDLEEVRQKVEKFHAKRETVSHHSAAQAAHAVSSCYRNNVSTPLDCWREVSAFRTSVAQMEQEYVASFQ